MRVRTPFSSQDAARAGATMLPLGRMRAPIAE